jgi:hypothetical protein
MSKDLKYTIWSSVFFVKFVLTDRGRLLRVICQLDVVHNWRRKLTQKSLDEK